jgi:hypothetical protein
MRHLLQRVPSVGSGWPDEFVKNIAQNAAHSTFLSKLIHILYCGKVAWKCGLIKQFKNNLPKVNYHPLEENSPNLVTPRGMDTLCKHCFFSSCADCFQWTAWKGESRCNVWLYVMPAARTYVCMCMGFEPGFSVPEAEAMSTAPRPSLGTRWNTNTLHIVWRVAKT